MLHMLYLTGPNMIWNEAEVIEKLSSLQLVLRQQTAFEVRTHIDHFSLQKYIKPIQTFKD